LDESLAWYSSQQNRNSLDRGSSAQLLLIVPKAILSHFADPKHHSDARSAKVNGWWGRAINGSNPLQSFPSRKSKGANIL